MTIYLLPPPSSLLLPTSFIESDYIPGGSRQQNLFRIWLQVGLFGSDVVRVQFGVDGFDVIVVEDGVLRLLERAEGAQVQGQGGVFLKVPVDGEDGEGAVVPPDRRGVHHGHVRIVLGIGLFSGELGEEAFARP